MPFDFKKYDEKCSKMDTDELQKEWEHYTRQISGASTSTAVSGLAIPLTAGVSMIGVGMAAPAIHNARKKREIIEKHLNRLGTTHHTRKRDVAGSMAFSGTLGVLTLGVGSMGADAIASAGAEHGIGAIVNNETAIKVGLHAALDGAAMTAEEAHHNHQKQKAAEKLVHKKQGELAILQQQQQALQQHGQHYQYPAYGEKQPLQQPVFEAVPIPGAYTSNANTTYSADVKSPVSPTPQYTPAPPPYPGPPQSSSLPPTPGAGTPLPQYVPQSFAPPTSPAPSVATVSTISTLPPYSPGANYGITPYQPAATSMPPAGPQQQAVSQAPTPPTPAPQTAQNVPPFTAYVAAPGFNPPAPTIHQQNAPAQHPQGFQAPNIYQANAAQRDVSYFPPQPPAATPTPDPTQNTPPACAPYPPGSAHSQQMQTALYFAPPPGKKGHAPNPAPAQQALQPPAPAQSLQRAQMHFPPPPGTAGQQQAPEHSPDQIYAPTPMHHSQPQQSAVQSPPPQSYAQTPTQYSAQPAQQRQVEQAAPQQSYDYQAGQYRQSTLHQTQYPQTPVQSPPPQQQAPSYQPQTYAAQPPQPPQPPLALGYQYPSVMTPPPEAQHQYAPFPQGSQPSRKNAHQSFQGQSAAYEKTQPHQAYATPSQTPAYEHQSQYLQTYAQPTPTNPAAGYAPPPQQSQGPAALSTPAQTPGSEKTQQTWPQYYAAAPPPAYDTKVAGVDGYPQAGAPVGVNGLCDAYGGMRI